ncbi:MAG: class I SAM-dependent methyltransferase [Sedimentisphaerales bacterium]|jgi:SAM-dependent methyltransferase
MRLSKYFQLFGVVLFFCATGCLSSERAPAARGERSPKQSALSMIKASNGRLAPVYAPLAEQIVNDLDLSEKEGIGIDLGSGPGTLVIELCKRTRMHWIDADINPCFFPYFMEQAEKHGFGCRVSAMFADACALPFRDNYADVIVSRGSFWIWKDQKTAFSEIYRVLKPGGIAYIGRGFSRTLPVETARKIRKGGRIKYDVDKTESDLRNMMNALKITGYKIHRPKPPGSEGVNYGIWIEFHKPAGR